MKPILKLDEDKQEEIKIVEPVYANIPILKPIKDRKTFESTDEFNEYFRIHNEEFLTLSTCKLNKMFNIPGYWITKIKGNISLKSVPEKRLTMNEISDRLDKTEKQIINLIDNINKVIAYINEHIPNSSTCS